LVGFALAVVFGIGADPLTTVLLFFEGPSSACSSANLLGALWIRGGGFLGSVLIVVMRIKFYCLVWAELYVWRCNIVCICSFVWFRFS